MNDEMKLSQEEIDALLRGEWSAPAPAEPDGPPPLSDEERDMLGEIGNISFGSAATSLSALLQRRVEITTPSVSVLRGDHLEADLARPYVMVMVEFTAGLSGSNALAVELEDAKTIADLMLGGDGRNVDVELNELHLSAVAEAMNQMMGGAATALSTLLGHPVNISPPQVRFVDLAAGDEFDLGQQEWVVMTSFRLRVEDLIDSSIMQLVPISFARELLDHLRRGMGAGDSAQAPMSPDDATEAQTPPASAQSRAATDAPKDQASALRERVASLDGAAAPEVAAAAERKPHSSAPQVQVKRPQFADFDDPAPPAAAPRNLSLLLDVMLDVTVELGRTRKSIREILDLAPGSVIELEKLAGESVDILVNGKRIATGEVVVIDENFGVRVTDILSPVDRVKKLQ
ncbi:flagellar motor switch phosphatase FliY [Alicyclobacillus macrosporangiidus]|uniref:Flagellar motor switch protein FliN/FliY n=1 Tax=Alicyclobacillus macrosporangiidus TaxID=392015 RepID=A0A1I7IQT8_9BACL|nr:flagellar motor switch phosphatase FliY [Alicyclobacillus macrosporangiidus]SFU75268.1 flagellar motor switch protein FliN/FliY [Alicyclobacillus macrosporangiidus]